METNKLLKGAAILVGAYAAWFFWNERKEAKAKAMSSKPADTPLQTLEKVVTTNPIPKVPIMLDDIKIGAKTVVDKVTKVVKGFADPIMSDTITPTPSMAQSASVSGNAGVGADALVNQVMPSKKMMGFGDSSEGEVSGLETTSIQNYCKCDDKSGGAPKSVLSKLKF